MEWANPEGGGGGGCGLKKHGIVAELAMGIENACLAGDVV